VTHCGRQLTPTNSNSGLDSIYSPRGSKFFCLHALVATPIELCMLGIFTLHTSNSNKWSWGNKFRSMIQLPPLPFHTTTTTTTAAAAALSVGVDCRCVVFVYRSAIVRGGDRRGSVTEAWGEGAPQTYCTPRYLSSKGRGRGRRGRGAVGNLQLLLLFALDCNCRFSFAFLLHTTLISTHQHGHTRTRTQLDYLSFPLHHFRSVFLSDLQIRSQTTIETRTMRYSPRI